LKLYGDPADVLIFIVQSDVRYSVAVILPTEENPFRGVDAPYTYVNIHHFLHDYPIPAEGYNNPQIFLMQ
jgi:hypothetical protein